MNEALPSFQFWVRRSHGDGAVFSVRFEVEEGKGLLRVARPGVLVDPPARESGFEERLTPAQVRASRFLHVWDGGRKRQGYVLSRLTDEVLNELTRGAWEQMKVVSDGGFCWLVPGTPEEPAEADLEPLPAEALELVAVEDTEHFEVVEPDTEAVPEGGAYEGAASEGGTYEGPIDEGALGEALAEHTSALPDVPEESGADDEESDTQLLTEEVEEPATLPPAEGAAFAPFGRATTLVRHLRREKLRDRQAIVQLRAEKERLATALAEAQARAAELQAREAELRSKLEAYTRVALPE